MVLKLFSSREHFESIALQEKIDELHNYYNPKTLDSAFHQKKKKALTKLDYILKHTTRRNMQTANFRHVLICSLTLVYYFGMKLNIEQLISRKPWNVFHKRNFYKAEATYQQTMNCLLPERSDVTIHITLNFFTEVSLWPYETFVVQILEVLLYYNRGKMRLFNALLTDIHYVLFTDVKSARHRMRVLYAMLKSENLSIDKHKLLPFVTRLLDLFSKGKDKQSVYFYVRAGFQVCLRRIFERVENQHRLVIITTMLNWFGMVTMCDDDVLEFSALLDRAAELYKVGSYNDSFSDGLINYVLKNLLGSSNHTYSLIGSRLLQRFLDRHGNYSNLTSPKIYFDFSQGNLTIGTYNTNDKAFIRKHRENFHTYILQACKTHNDKSVNLKSLFFVICCIILEVPCGLTAASAACIAMSIQDFALNGQNISQTCRYWMHALVISVMSLICWVHKSQVLYSYVNQIIWRRAREAPQLNPPLRQVYNIGYHHVTWNKPTLFFEDWELRYGLWKHFADQLLVTVAILLILVVTGGHTKKVVIHVPVKVKKIKHTHTIYKTVHHHHIDHSPMEEHEHFHHMHIHEEGPGQHSQPVPGIGIPEFLPDVPEVELTDIPPDMPVPLSGSNRHVIPLFRRKIGRSYLTTLT